MSLVRKAPGTVYVTIKHDFSRIQASLRNMQRLLRRMGMVMAQAEARLEWRNLEDAIHVWESEGGAL